MKITPILPSPVAEESKEKGHFHIKPKISPLMISAGRGDLRTDCKTSADDLHITLLYCKMTGNCGYAHWASGVVAAKARAKEKLQGIIQYHRAGYRHGLDKDMISGGSRFIGIKKRRVIRIPNTSGKIRAGGDRDQIAPGFRGTLAAAAGRQ